MFKIKRICIPLSFHCNLYCKYCYLGNRNFKSPNFTVDMIDYLHNLSPEWCQCVCATGGEPLLYFDKVKELFSYVPKNVHKKIISNCTLLTQEMVNYINDNAIELSFSHDGFFTKFLRGIDILENENIKSLLFQVENLMCQSVITKYNTDIWSNYFDTITKLQRTNFFYRSSPVGDIRIDKDLIKDFNYKEWLRTMFEFALSPYAYKSQNYSDIYLNKQDSYLKERTYKGRTGGFDILPDGSICSMAFPSLVLGSVKTSTYEECWKKAVEFGLIGFCEKSNCKYIKVCEFSPSFTSEHICKCRQMAFDFKTNENMEKIREYVSKYLSIIEAEHNFDRSVIKKAF